MYYNYGVEPEHLYHVGICRTYYNDVDICAPSGICKALGAVVGAHIDQGL